jgi:hypothetical protein
MNRKSLSLKTKQKNIFNPEPETPRALVAANPTLNIYPRPTRPRKPPQPPISYKPLIIAKALTIFISSLTFFLLKRTQTFLGVNPASPDQCLIDYSVNFYQTANKALNHPSNVLLRDWIQLISSLQIDLGFVGLCIIW